MLPRDNPDAKVKADKRFIVQPVNGVGFSLVPKPGNVGGYPLVVIVNDDDKNPITITGPGYFRSAATIAKLEADAALGGGVAGDLWTVTILPAATGYEQARFRSSTDGYLALRNAPPVTLFDIDSVNSPQPFIDAFKDGFTGDIYVSPANPAAFTPDTSAWDVSRFSQVLFVVEQTGPRSWWAQCFLDLVGRSDGMAVHKVGMGSKNNIGSDGMDPWALGVAAASVNAGAPVEAVGDNDATTGRKLPYARFRIFVLNNMDDWAGVNWTNEYLRIYAKAW